MVDPTDRKKPIGGMYACTRDELEIANKLSNHLGNPGIFVALKPAGLIDIDLDVRESGSFRDSLPALEEALGVLPPTWTVITPSGGEHRFYRAPDDLPKLRKDVADFVEIKVNATAPLPPSVHHSGDQYAWKPGCAPWQIELAELPPEWIEFASARVRERGDPRVSRSPRASAEMRLSPSPDYCGAAVTTKTRSSRRR